MDHGTIPQKPEQLDDNKVKVYGKLKTWRLRHKNESGHEPYNKICQDRTLCELIRRRRNDSGFASRRLGDPNTKYVANNGTFGEAAVVRDLLSIWGIGP